MTSFLTVHYDINQVQLVSSFLRSFEIFHKNFYAFIFPPCVLHTLRPQIVVIQVSQLFVVSPFTHQNLLSYRSDKHSSETQTAILAVKASFKVLRPAPYSSHGQQAKMWQRVLRDFLLHIPSKKFIQLDRNISDRTTSDRTTSDRNISDNTTSDYTTSDRTTSGRNNQIVLFQIVLLQIALFQIVLLQIALFQIVLFQIVLLQIVLFPIVLLQIVLFQMYYFWSYYFKS